MTWSRLRKSIREDDEEQLSRITEFVIWAAAQRSDELASALDLAFFLPVFRDPELREHLENRIPEMLFSEKRRLLMNDSD